MTSATPFFNCPCRLFISMFLPSATWTSQFDKRTIPQQYQQVNMIKPMMMFHKFKVSCATCITEALIPFSSRVLADYKVYP